MNEIYVYLVDMPLKVNEMVIPCFDGYTVYINARLAYQDQVNAYQHALRHVERNDWNKCDVEEIEIEAHKEDP